MRPREPAVNGIPVLQLCRVTAHGLGTGRPWRRSTALGIELGQHVVEPFAVLAAGKAFLRGLASGDESRGMVGQVVVGLFGVDRREGYGVLLVEQYPASLATFLRLVRRQVGRLQVRRGRDVARTDRSRLSHALGANSTGPKADEVP